VWEAAVRTEATDLATEIARQLKFVRTADVETDDAIRTFLATLKVTMMMMMMMMMMMIDMDDTDDDVLRVMTIVVTTRTWLRLSCHMSQRSRLRSGHS
jgi:hypothetical protein